MRLVLMHKADGGEVVLAGEEGGIMLVLPKNL